jgi:hypothetical protein
MWTHFVNLLGKSWHLFLVGQGTTALGFWSPYSIGGLSALVAGVAVLALRGIEAMKQHWKQTLGIVFGAAVAANLIWYGPIFGWDLIKTVYGDHQFLVASNHEAEVEIHKRNDRIRQQDEEIARLTMPKTLANPIPKKQTPAQVPPEPILTGIRIASQKRIPSDDSELPYGLEVVVQTDADISPVAVGLLCDGPIGKGDAAFANIETYIKKKEGRAGRKDAFLAEWESPAWTPAAPIVFHVYSATPINATEIRRFTYSWP